MSEAKPNQIAAIQAQEQQNPDIPESEATAPPLSPFPKGNIDILREAFPSTDLEVIEAVLQAQNDDVESSFEVLLGMSDPNYKAAQATPPMPPRPQNSAPYTYWQQQEQQQQQQTERPISVEEQMRLDEAFAKQLMEEDRRNSEQRRQQQQHSRRNDEDEPLFNFQEELPIIKEKMKEAGNAAKKKVLDFYNQLKANTQKNMGSYQQESSGSSSMPTTNAQYRGLPSDDGDDLLTGEISALHLSDYDVYAQAGQRQRQFEEKKFNNAQPKEHGEESNTIYVNPPITDTDHLSAKIQTSTSDVQLKADEDFARQLAEEEQQQMRERRSRQSSANNDLPALTTPSRKPVSPTVVIAPRSPLELGDSDYEDVGLTAAPSYPKVPDAQSRVEKDKNAETLVPYIIGDDDDDDESDLDGLVDAEEEEQDKQKENNKQKGTSEVVNKPDLADQKEHKTEQSDIENHNNTKA